MPQPRELTSQDVTDLYSMLTYMRPHYSGYEEAFITRFLKPLEMRMDSYGNIFKRVGEAPIAWSCHTDTVHRKGGVQYIARDDKQIVRLAKKEKLSNCLGADDTAGVWLMTQMIKAEVPGLYMFHRGEEEGCKGSKHVADKTPKLLDGIKFVVALDRRDVDNVITFQAGQRCCSEDFAKSISEQLNAYTPAAGALKYKADPTGMYTDSASYVDIVGECTNLSVGYFGQHGFNESLDLNHIVKMYDALVRVDVNKLVAKRVAGTKENRFASYSSYGGHGNGHWHNNGGNASWRINYYAEQYRDYIVTKSGDIQKATHQEWEKWRTKTVLGALLVKGKKIDKADATELAKLTEIIKINPEQMAVMFLAWGFDVPMLREALLDAYFHQVQDEEVKDQADYAEGYGCF